MGGFVKTARRWGLTVNIKKTKGMAVRWSMGVMDSSPVQLEDGTIETVSDFTYLGSNVASDGGLSQEILCHIPRRPGYLDV